MITDPTALTSWLLASVRPILLAVLDALTHIMTDRGSVVWQSMSSGVNSSAVQFVTRTPPELSYNLGSVADLYRGWEPALFGVVTLACVLAGIAAMGREYFGWSWAPGEYAARLFLGVLLVLSIPRIYIFSIDLVNRVSEAIIGAPLPDVPGDDMDPITRVVLIIVWVVLGFRLLWRMAYRLVYLDVLLILGPLAMMCWVLPGGQPYAKRWITTYIGLLVGQVLVVICLRLAAALAGPGGSTWGGIALGVGVLLLAYDMATWLADIKGGGLVGVVRATVGVARGKVI